MAQSQSNKKIAGNSKAKGNGSVSVNPKKTPVAPPKPVKVKPRKIKVK